MAIGVCLFSYIVFKRWNTAYSIYPPSEARSLSACRYRLTTYWLGKHSACVFRWPLRRIVAEGRLSVLNSEITVQLGRQVEHSEPVGASEQACGRGMAATFLRALALATTLACCAAWAVQGQDPNAKIGPHEVLIRVIRVNNGTVDLDVRDVPGKGRGLVAFRDMAKNQVAVHLPRAMAFQLAPVTKALEVRPPPPLHPTLPSANCALVPAQRGALAQENSQPCTVQPRCTAGKEMPPGARAGKRRGAAGAQARECGALVPGLVGLTAAARRVPLAPPALSGRQTVAASGRVAGTQPAQVPSFW